MPAERKGPYLSREGLAIHSVFTSLFVGAAEVNNNLIYFILIAQGPVLKVYGWFLFVQKESQIMTCVPQHTIFLNDRESKNFYAT